MKQVLTVIALLAFGAACFAQTDTLRYDGLANANDGTPFGVTQFPGETAVIVNTRFSPTEKCTVLGVTLAFGLVKFQPTSGPDTLLVYVYEDEPLPPGLRNIQKTYRVPLGNTGFPSPNIHESNPWDSRIRDTMTVFFDPPVVLSPKRDFVVGIDLVTLQSMPADTNGGRWRGLFILAKQNSKEFQRYRRYSLGANGAPLQNPTATSKANISMFMRAIVKYDTKLPPFIPTASDVPSSPMEVQFHQNYPNPVSESTRFSYTLRRSEQVTVAVYDVMGRHIATLVDGPADAGTHALEFDAARFGLPGGIYTANLTANGERRTVRFLLLR
jgi:hypothetical protein